MVCVRPVRVTCRMRLPSSLIAPPGQLDEVVGAQVGGHVVEEGADQAGQLESQIPAHGLLPKRGQEALLSLHAAEIQVAVVTEAHVVESVVAVQQLVAGLQIDRARRAVPL